MGFERDLGHTAGLELTASNMPTMFDTTAHREIIERIKRLAPDASRQWGKMSAPEMIAHLSDQMRHTLGDVPVAPRPGWMRTVFVRYFVIYWLPWPKGRVQGPAEAFVTKPVDWESDIAILLELVDRFVTHGPRGEWPEHAFFGRMSGRDWGFFCYKHFNHHLTQFGV